MEYRSTAKGASASDGQSLVAKNLFNTITWWRELIQCCIMFLVYKLRNVHLLLFSPLRKLISFWLLIYENISDVVPINMGREREVQRLHQTHFHKETKRR